MCWGFRAGEMEIRIDDLQGPEIRLLIQEHLRHAAERTPPGSIHALGIEGLRAPDITFWTLWDNGELLGCGALKELDREHGEVKSMRTAYAYQRRGVAARMLEHIIAEAQRRKYRRLSLETGSQESFEPARALYRKFGFAECGPFNRYTDDPNGTFMTRHV